MTASELFDKYSVDYNIKQLIEPMELMNKHQFIKAVAEIISFPLELPVSQENGGQILGFSNVKQDLDLLWKECFDSYLSFTVEQMDFISSQVAQIKRRIDSRFSG